MKNPVREQATPECCDVVVPQPEGPQWQDEDEEVAELAKALGHPARVRIVRFLLAQGENTCICGDICDAIPLAQSTVSQHLKVLKRAGIIRGTVDGPRVCYCVDREQLQRLKDLVAEL